MGYNKIILCCNDGDHAVEKDTRGMVAMPSRKTREAGGELAKKLSARCGA